MRTPSHLREAPDGWQPAERETNTWRIGWVFLWSESYQLWYELPGDNRLTIKPGVCVATALEGWLNDWQCTNTGNDYEVFQPTSW